MRQIKYAFLLFFFWILYLNLWAAPQISNVIIFGDSLSDIGNFPESVTPYADPSKTHDLDNFYPEFYIPVSNPVVTTPQAYSAPIAKMFSVGVSHGPYPLPALTNDTLAPQPDIDTQPRANRSMIWPEFLVADSYRDGMIASQAIEPSIYLQDSHSPYIHSVDYAWSSALSNDTCNDINYSAFSATCNQANVDAQWSNYSKNRTLDQKTKVMIPGMMKQVSFFLEDLHNNKVQVDEQTAYMFNIGGNDLSNNFDKLQTGTLKERITAAKGIAYQTGANNYLAMKRLIDDPKAQVKNIYLFELFDPKLTPKIAHWKPLLQHLGTLLTGYYNDQLKLDAKLIMKKYPGVTVHIVPVFDWFNQMASGQGPYKGVIDPAKIGSDCESSNSQYYDSTQTPSDNCKGYLFWNAIHPAMPAEQIEGYLLEQTIK